MYYHDKKNDCSWHCPACSGHLHAADYSEAPMDRANAQRTITMLSRIIACNELLERVWQIHRVILLSGVNPTHEYVTALAQTNSLLVAGIPSEANVRYFSQLAISMLGSR